MGAGLSTPAIFSRAPMTDNTPMTAKEIQDSLAEAWRAQMEINELHIGAIYAIAIRLGISHEQLIRESASIIKKIEDGQNPWG